MDAVSAKKSSKYRRELYSLMINSNNRNKINIYGLLSVFKNLGNKLLNNLLNHFMLLKYS